MHWILQENLFKEAEWENLTTALKRLELPYSVHKVVPFVGELIPRARPRAPAVICLGAYSMRHIAKRAGWTPGVYDIYDQDFLVQRSHWRELMLNHDSDVVKFKDARIDGRAFMRPINDSKHFSGRVFGDEELQEWQKNVVLLGEDHGDGMNGDTLVQVCKPKEIYAEFRYWIVGGKIVTRSLYKRGDKVFYSSEVDPHFDEFVNRCLWFWVPHRAFVIDVCDTPDGIKIVEINTLNASGFYAADVTKLVIALEELESGHA